MSDDTQILAEKQEVLKKLQEQHAVLQKEVAMKEMKLRKLQENKEKIEQAQDLVTLEELEAEIDDL